MKNAELKIRFSGEKIRFSDDAAIGRADVLKESRPLLEPYHMPPLISIKGNAWADGELLPGMTYLLYGHFQEYANRRTGRSETQFVFNSAIPIVPKDSEGVIAYLDTIGKGLGLGRGTARKAWDEWGEEAVSTIRQHPLRICELNRRITEEQAEAIGEKLVRQEAVENVMIELTNLLHGRGFPKTLPKKLVDEWGVKAGEVVRRDPYQLMRFRACGFKLTDSLYLHLGKDRKRLKRQALCAWYSAASETNATGNVWHLENRISTGVREAIGSAADPERALMLATRLGNANHSAFGALSTIQTDGPRGAVSEFGRTAWVAEGKHARHENRIARLVTQKENEGRPSLAVDYVEQIQTELQPRDHVRCHRCLRELTAPEVHVVGGKPYGPTCINHVVDSELAEVVNLEDWWMQNPVPVQWTKMQPAKLVRIADCSLWPDVNELEVDEHQKEQLDKALVSRIGILGGSPGTGKTYTVAQLVKVLLRSGLVAPEDILIGAPTGKAAVRVTENLDANGVKKRARTWHSLLGIGEVDPSTGQAGFAHNEHNPWQARIVIGDESSMLDQALMDSILSACPRGCHILLVGDVNQLPPVGPGAPMRDMIASGVAYGELRKIKRNSGGIVEACAAIRDGNIWSAGDNLHLVECLPDQQMQAVSDILDQVRASGLDPVWDAQILTAVNKASDVARTAINKEFQGKLNASPGIAGSPFRVHDKVVCLANGWFPLQEEATGDVETNDDGKVYVANGEIGRVQAVEAKLLHVKLDAPERLIVVPRGKASDAEDGGDEESCTGCKWDLAYGLTCHKLQGSECPVVIVLIDEHSGAKRICDRSWLYTAISRAKAHCYLVGSKITADGFCRRNSIDQRKTFLREQIHIQRLSMELCEL